MKSEPLNQYTEIYRDAIKSSSAKLSKTFENQLLEILLLYMTIQRKINFTQMNQLDFSYNASFASQNVAKVMMKENGMPYSMASFKEVMASTDIAKLIFDKCRRIPNRKIISHTVKELFGWQRKAA